MEPYEQALSKAKIQLMNHPDTTFFTTICFSLKHRFSEEIPTACTDGLEIIFNPNFFMSLTADEKVFLLLHETLHVAYMHMARLSSREPKKWNIAADHVINLMLKARGFKMPKMGFADPRYADMSTDEVYEALPDSKDVQFDMDLKESTVEPEKLQEAVEEILVRASVQAKIDGNSAGSIPEDLQIFIDRLLKPKLPWKNILQKFLNNFAKDDYSFRKPNRRYFPQFYLPSLYSTKLMDIAVAVDISGSVTDEDFTHFITEVHSILRMMKPDKLTLLQFNTNITNVDQIKTVKELSDIKFSGRGGTRIQPVMDWANTNKPQLLLVFTDGYFRFFENSTTKVNTLWLIHENPKFNPPAGKVIHYTLKD